MYLECKTDCAVYQNVNKTICFYLPSDEIDECQSLPCLNNGICSDLPDSYECICTPGYSGNNCEIDEDLCEPNPCLSGGTCVERADMYICVCPSGRNIDVTSDESKCFVRQY